MYRSWKYSVVKSTRRPGELLITRLYNMGGGDNTSDVIDNLTRGDWNPESGTTELLKNKGLQTLCTNKQTNILKVMPFVRPWQHMTARAAVTVTATAQEEGEFQTQNLHQNIVMNN